MTHGHPTTVPKPRLQNPKIAQDFNDAINRLQQGTPKNATLRAAAKRGTLKINYSTVAKEAGHSRTLIAVPGKACAFPEIRQRIENLKTQVANPTNSNQTISVLRAEVKLLKQKLVNQQHQWRADQTARAKAEADRDRWKDEFNRLLRKNTKDNTENIVGLVPSAKS